MSGAVLVVMYGGTLNGQVVKMRTEDTGEPPPFYHYGPIPNMTTLHVVDPNTNWSKAADVAVELYKRQPLNNPQGQRIGWDYHYLPDQEAATVQETGAIAQAGGIS